MQHTKGVDNMHENEKDLNNSDPQEYNGALNMARKKKKKKKKGFLYYFFK